VAKIAFGEGESPPCPPTVASPMLYLRKYKGKDQFNEHVGLLGTSLKL